jgi:hypothetical protein
MVLSGSEPILSLYRCFNAVGNVQGLKRGHFPGALHVHATIDCAAFLL